MTIPCASMAIKYVKPGELLMQAAELPDRKC